MGKTRTAFVGEVSPEQKPRKKEKKRSLKEERGIRVPGMGGGERVVAVTAELPPEKPQEQVSQAKRIKVHKRGRRYLANLSKIDPTQHYSIPQAVELAKQTSLSRFDGKVELHLVLAKRGRFEVALPHPHFVQKRVEVADKETLKKLEGGKIDFDILLATPEFMRYLIPYAKLLGPRGVMPNPKNGTIVTNPKQALEKFSKSVVLQTEKDAPLLHTVVGKVTDEPKNLVENIESIFSAIGPHNIKKAIISPTMGPGIKMAVD